MKNRLVIALAAAAAFLLPGQAGSVTPDPFLGTWRNPGNSVHVKTYACGPSLCGQIIWANDNQQEAARKAGTAQLIGKQLFTDFALNGQIRKGKVFVPKQGRIFPGTVTIVDANTMEVRGCALGGLICRSQTWTRLAS
jgi:uncharacterized protein (DUF2147 family)